MEKEPEIFKWCGVGRREIGEYILRLEYRVRFQKSKLSVPGTLRNWPRGMI